MRRLLITLLIVLPLDCAAAISFVSHGGTKGVNVSTLTFSISVTANDTACVGVNIINTSNTVLSVGDNGGSTYSRKVQGGYFDDEIWCTPAGGAHAATSITVTLSGLATATVSGADYSGVAAFGLSSSGSGGTPPGSETITLSGVQSGAWVLAYFGDNVGIVATASTGSLRDSQVDPTYGEDGFLCDSITSTCAVSTTGNTHWSAVALELDPSTAPPPPPPSGGSSFDVVTYGGAKCDGVTNDAAAIQRTNDDATTANFSLVTFPAKTCINATGVTQTTSWSGVTGSSIVKFTGTTGPGFFLHGILLKNEGLTFICSAISASACFQVGGANSQLNRFRDLQISCNSQAPNAASIGLEFLTPTSGANYFNTVESGWYISWCGTAIQTDALANAQQVGMGVVFAGVSNGLLIQTTEGEYHVFCSGAAAHTATFICAHLQATSTSNVLANIVYVRAEPGPNSRTYQLEAAVSGGGSVLNNLLIVGDNSPLASQDLSGHNNNMILSKFGIASTGPVTTPSSTLP